MNGSFSLVYVLLVLAIAVAIAFAVMVPQVQATGETLDDFMAEHSSDSMIGKLNDLHTKCSLWRAPPSYFEPAALTTDLVSKIKEVFPTSECSIEYPHTCEMYCSCLIKMKLYCDMSGPKANKKFCLEDSCRVTLEG